MSGVPGDQRRGRWRPRAAVGLAVAILLVVPSIPGALASGSVAELVRLPVESLVILLLLTLTPWRVPRLVLATLFGGFVGIAILLAGIDRGYQSALGIHFVPLDWLQLGDAYGVVAAAIGALPASGLFTAAGAAVVGASAAVAWAAMRVDRLIRSRGESGRRALAAVTAAWIVAAAVATPLGVADPVAAAASTSSVGSAVSRTVAALQTRAAVAREIAADRFAGVPATQLVSRLAGKHIVIVFVESYGRVALDESRFSAGVREVLARGDEMLAAEGYRTRSAWLTSPTFGGVSWLAHATLQSGIWVDSQAVYDLVVRSDRLTLAAAFGEAGWRTVSDVPSNRRPWDVGSSFYHYDTLLDGTNVGYRGPAFSYARVPDQYTLKHFADEVLVPSASPVMAEIDLVSSHTPWAPLPQLVPWDQAGDGRVYDGQPKAGEPAAEVWKDPRQVQRSYGRSIEYSLGSLLSFLENVDDPDLVVIALGDHQPSAIVSGEGAGHDVPVSIIAKDPAVFDAIAGWRWRPGLRPDHVAPIWRMDAFRDRFFDAFGAPR
ncbi:alkaline phosphatase family protein [Microbacterium timonense]|uniref:hypothetical protein n=1 Tax=Microbacterium timonense TaxID=2086576 RepID=UPI000D10BB43|nr:hypothetical protein [Microbacterium timonense]